MKQNISRAKNINSLICRIVQIWAFRKSVKKLYTRCKRTLQDERAYNAYQRKLRS